MRPIASSSSIRKSESWSAKLRGGRKESEKGGEDETIICGFGDILALFEKRVPLRGDLFQPAKRGAVAGLGKGKTGKKKKRGIIPNYWNKSETNNPRQGTRYVDLKYLGPGGSRRKKLLTLS